ncbi:DNA-binding NarL/FixJ family response regulator [Motilibacter peucedani]|uniref:DNA-binding NarL/FixJ family response regulator n=1 Tax=Motilibacter peucedani TaxID=598650 RepID=A0A420XUK2_9ACTN|nr:DNA-binding NarL/FixJ family response regulator [Motilibacter peucedani]
MGRRLPYGVRVSSSPIRVVLAEDNALLRQGLTRLVAAADDLDLVGTATDIDSLFALVAEHDPDVVISDIRMPPTGTDEGIRAAQRLRAERPRVGVVLLSAHAEAAYALRLLEGGSAGRAYLLKERVAGVSELADAVRTVAAGGSVIDPTVVERLVAASSAPARSPLHALTAREREVLGHMAQGKSNAAIAGDLFLTERAIEKHTNSIFSKLGLTEEKDLNRRVSAVLVYLEGSGRAS